MPETNASQPQTQPTETATPASSATPSSSTPAAGAAQPRNADGTFTSVRDYRLTAEDAQSMGLPQWAVGRSAAEGFQLAQQLYQQTLSGGQSQPAAQPAAPQGYAGQPTPQGRPGAPTADDWATDPVGAQQRYNEWFYSERIAPQFANYAAQNAATSLALARQQEQKAFSRWEPEIMMRLNAVDRSLWTPENIATIVGMVKAQHLDELAAERAEAVIQQRMQAGALARPSDSGGTSANASQALDLDISALPPNMQDMLRDTRLVRDDQLTAPFWEFCDKMKAPGQTREQWAKEWFESAKKGDTLVAEMRGRSGDGDPRARVGDAGVFGGQNG